MFDVICVGSATVDAFAQTEGKFFKGKQYCFPVGTKLLIEKLEFHTGGGGTNAAVSLSRMGLKTAYIGKVGKGTNSNRVIKTLKCENVDVSMIARDDARTGYSIILNAEGHDRTVFAFKGGNNDLKIKDIKFSRMKTRWLYFSSMMGESFKTIEKTAVWAKKNNIKIAFNPSTYLAEKGRKHINKILERCDILVMNDEEAKILAGGDNTNENLRILHGWTKGIVAVTEGKKGVHATDGKKMFSLKASKIKVVDATGAGDAFASAFLAGMIKNNDMNLALRLGMANAESVISKFGTKAGLMKYKDAEKKASRTSAVSIRKL